MSNPFETIDARLSNIEMLLLSIKHPEPASTKAETSETTFTIGELAVYLKCTKKTAQAYKSRGIFPYYQTGRTVFFKKSEVDKALAVGTKKKGVSN